jgi:hypothetical protein
MQQAEAAPSLDSFHEMITKGESTRETCQKHSKDTTMCCTECPCACCSPRLHECSIDAIAQGGVRKWCQRSLQHARPFNMRGQPLPNATHAHTQPQCHAGTHKPHTSHPGCVKSRRSVPKAAWCGP